MFAGLDGEDDGADTLDLHGGGVPELDGALNAGVELGEELPPPGHVVGGAGVKVPPVDLVAAGPVAEEDVSPRLVEVEERGGGRRRRGVWLDAPVYEEQSRLVTLLCLRDVCLTAALRLPAVLGPVAGPPAVIAGVVAGSLALAVGAVRSATTRLVPLVRPTLAAARRTRGLPLLPLPLAGEPLLLGEEKLATDGDWL